MNPLIVSFNTKTTSDSLLEGGTESYLNTITNNNGYRSWAESKISKTPPAQFIADMLHELRNPMTSINLSIELLRSPLTENDHDFYLNIIGKNASRINDMINELIKCQQSGGEQKEDHSIRQLLEEALESAAEKINSKKIIVTKNYAAPDHKIVLNKAKMKIAMTNIIMNAISATPPEKGELKLATRSINGKYLIEIEDNGIGISEENLKNIFKEYFTNMPGAAGMGLSATLDILLSQQASVAVQSEEGIGTRFIFSFDEIKEPAAFLDITAAQDIA
ncbi:MAG: HAMP domain-containing sensor histidine kinase [Ferruginibacter sp.]